MTTRPTDPSGHGAPDGPGLNDPAPGATDIDLPSSALWLQRIFRHNTRAIAIATWDGRFELCNTAYEALLGYTQGELREMRIADLVHPDDRADNLALIDKLRTGELPTFEVENRSIRKDGSAVWVNTFVSALPDRTGAPAHVVAMVNDIDDRKRWERENEVKATLLDLSADAILVRDRADRIEYWNRGAEQIYGFSREQAMGHVAHELLHTEFPEAIDDIRAELRRTGLWSGELAHTRADGRRIVTLSRWQVAEGADGIRVMETNTDITERTEVEAALRESEERFRATFEHAPVGVAHVALEGDFLRVNDAFVTICGRSRDELEGLRFQDITHRDDVGADVEFANQLIAGDIASYSLEKRYVRGDGTAVWISLTGSLVRKASGEPDYFVAVIEDIDERRAAAETLRRAAAAEHGISLRLQHALLPEQLAYAETLQVAARYSAVGELLEVGGDWYDAIALRDGRVCFVVGDVVGHGLDAAAVMGRLRAGFAALAAHEPCPGRLLTALDEFARSAHGTDFATIGCAVVDPATGAVEYASAGHPPMLVVEPDGALRWLDGGRSAPLATVTMPERPSATDRLGAGSLLIAYSDGLIERRGRRFGEGMALLGEAVAAVRPFPVQIVCDRLVAAMTATAPSDDDIVVLAVRYEPDATTIFRRVIPAEGTALAPLRAELREWLVDRGLSATTTQDVLLVVGEACANAVEHAYLDRAEGTVDVVVTAGARALRVEVRDHGAWRPPGYHSLDRGRGTGVMQALTRDFARTTGDEGTVVSMDIAPEVVMA